MIKAEQCITTFTGENQSLPQSTVETFSVCINSWLSSLKKLDRRGQYAIRRSSEGDIGRFHLRDQIWIWRALTSVDKLRKRIGSRLSLTVKDYGAGKFLSNILNRFTTESPLAGQRMSNGNLYPKMVALSRTPQENRFLLHARDTALFNDMDPQMAVSAIPGPLEAENPWLATIYAQPYHESDDTAWTKPLRFGLSVLMASKGFRLNNRSAQEAFYHCREVLFQKSSKNGLFPGLLEQNQDPVSIPEWFAQKPYWRASFELPYILFHCRTPAEVTPQAPNNQQANMNSAQQVEPSAATIPTSSPVAPGVDQRPVHYPGRNSLKKLTPVSHLVDQSSILELQEEWLYNYPEFLDFTPLPMPGPRTPRRGGRQARSVVLDVPSAKHATRSAARSSSVYDQAWDSQAAGGIRAACGGARTAAAAKKRLVWLCGAVDDQTRNLCVRVLPLRSDQHARLLRAARGGGQVLLGRRRRRTEQVGDRVPPLLLPAPRRACRRHAGRRAVVVVRRLRAAHRPRERRLPLRRRLLRPVLDVPLRARRLARRG